MWGPFSPAEWAVVAVSFFLMEGGSYLAHRFVMHKVGRFLHDSHHQVSDGGFELNDLYPVMFAGFTIMAMAAGAYLPDWRPLLVVGTGVTIYGLAYMFVHDVYIHRRLPFFTGEVAWLERLRNAHRIHHLYGGEPYGMLFPVVPRELAERAARTERDPLPRRARPAAPVISPL